jgi:hypothetical protein
MSSPFQKTFMDKSPLKPSDEKLMHATASVNDKYAVDLTGKYDKDYDKLTDEVGYVDPDATITTSEDTNPTAPILFGPDAKKKNKVNKHIAMMPSSSLVPVVKNVYKKAKKLVKKIIKK